MSAEHAGVPASPAKSAAWPRWAALTLIVSGIVVIVAETTSYLVIVGILLTVVGAYEIALASRSRRPVVPPPALN